MDFGISLTVIFWIWGIWIQLLFKSFVHKISSSYFAYVWKNSYKSRINEKRKRKKQTGVKTFFSVTVLINSDRIHNTIKGLSERKKSNKKNNSFKISQLVDKKSTKPYAWNPGSFDSDDGSEPTQSPEFLVLQ